MKNTTLKISQDILLMLNQLKYKWQMKTQDEVIRRLVEIASKFETAEEMEKRCKKQ